MNQQKLNELEEQAWAYQVRVYNEPDGSRTYGEKERVFSREKFARLIVQECVSLFDGTKEMKTVGMLSSAQVIEQIKEHFGVGE